MADLITANDYKTALGIPTSDTSQDAKIEAAIHRASSAISNYTRRDFATAEDATPTTRRYAYDGNGLVDLDDLVTGSVVEVALVPWGGSSGYVLNATDYSVEPSDPGAEVQSWIEITPGIGVSPLGEGFLRNIDTFGYGRVRAQRGYVDVTAKFGWAEVPGDVQQAAIWTTAAFLENPKPYISKSVAEVSVTYPNPITEAIPERARSLLDGYIKPRIAAA